MSTNLTLADMILAYLHELGINEVFGIPGGYIQPFFDALARSEKQGKTKAIITRHETGASYMADGYFRSTGKIGVCCATAGPGAINMLTGVACGFTNNSPILAITAQTVSATFGKRAMQSCNDVSVDTVAMYKNATKYSTLISDPAQLEFKLIYAIQLASSLNGGPVHLSIPPDVLNTPWNGELKYNLKNLKKSELIDLTALEKFESLFFKSFSPVALIGPGCITSFKTVLDFLNLHQVPFVTSPHSKGFVDNYSTFYRGVFGFAGHRSAEAALKEADLIMAIGTNFDEFSSKIWDPVLLNNKLIHIDEREENLRYSPEAVLHVQGNIETIFKKLTENRLIPRYRENQFQFEIDNIDSCTSTAEPIKPQSLMCKLAELFQSDTVFFADGGNGFAWAIHYLNLEHDKSELKIRQFPSVDFGPMGWGISSSIGFAAGDRQVPVVSITGDGSFLMNGQEITTALAENLTVIFVILNDSSFGMVRHGQVMCNNESIGHILPEVNFADFARSMGVEAYTIKSISDLNNIDIKAICNKRGPTLLDVYIDPDEVPPIAMRNEMLKH